MDPYFHHHAPHRQWPHGRPVVHGGAGGAMAPPDFGRSVNPISTWGTDYAHQIILAPPDFQTYQRPCDAEV